MATTAPATGNITIDDVRSALGQTDPNTTNSGKLRDILGRGSLATIQKHLEQVRKERAPVLPGTQAPPPAAPKDVMEAIWSSAWSAAQAMTYGRTERLSVERDAALTLSQTQASDIASLTANVDVLMEKITIAENNAGASAVKVEAELEAATKAAEQAAKELDAMTAAKAKVEADAAHAAALATRDAQIAAQTMQATIDRLNDQVSDLKGLLIVRTTPAPVSTTTQGV